jgi:very-short-patch-repair endonuclease
MLIKYNSKNKHLSRVLRKKSTLAEVLLWNELKGRKILNYQFMRQKPIGNYIVDFYCSPLKLVVEIDGLTHIGKEDYDLKREKYLISIGLIVLRFFDNDVKQNMSGVIGALYEWIDKNKKLQPPAPFSKGE